MKRNLSMLAVAILLTSLSGFSQTYKSLSFYNVAHQDDWQLFMGTNAWNDVSDPNGKVVFIYFTAGNNEPLDNIPKDPCNPTTSMAYWKVRELGAKSSVRVIGPVNTWGPATFPIPSNTSAVINGHTIAIWNYQNTTSYFLRLDDSKFGAPWNGTSPIPAFDGSTIYSDWCDLTRTVGAIYTRELTSTGQTGAWLNIHDIDATKNPGDHSSHILAAKASIDAMHVSTNFSTALFVGYATNDPATYPSYPHNLNYIYNEDESALFTAYALTLLNSGSINEFPFWRDAMDANYYRTVWGGDLSSGIGIACKKSAVVNKPGGDLADIYSVYPVPASNILTFKAEASGTVNLNIEVISPMGEKVLTKSVSSGQEDIDIKNLQAGRYTVHVHDVSTNQDSYLPLTIVR